MLAHMNSLPKWAQRATQASMRTLEVWAYLERKMVYVPGSNNINAHIILFTNRTIIAKPGSHQAAIEIGEHGSRHGHHEAPCTPWHRRKHGEEEGGGKRRRALKIEKTMYWNPCLYAYIGLQCVEDAVDESAGMQYVCLHAHANTLHLSIYRLEELYDCPLTRCFRGLHLELRIRLLEPLACCCFRTPRPAVLEVDKPYLGPPGKKRQPRKMSLLDDFWGSVKGSSGALERSRSQIPWIPERAPFKRSLSLHVHCFSKGLKKDNPAVPAIFRGPSRSTRR